MYELQFTHDAQRFYERADPALVRRLHRCFDHLRLNPYEHANVKRLRGPLAGCFRYRAGDWRVVYRVSASERLVTILLIAHRSEVYQ